MVLKIKGHCLRVSCLGNYWWFVKMGGHGFGGNHEFCLGHTEFGATMEYPNKDVSKFLDMRLSELEYLN